MSKEKNVPDKMKERKKKKFSEGDNYFPLFLSLPFGVSSPSNQIDMATGVGGKAGLGEGR